jgi:glycoprotein-N-acetylgalactosamine 3-beta-galactosyltransferase
VTGGYHSGGASYVLSRESLKRFHEAYRDPNAICHRSGAEDVQIAKCLRQKGVYAGESIDENDRERFHPLSFSAHFNGAYPSWMYKYAENTLSRVSLSCVAYVL